MLTKEAMLTTDALSQEYMALSLCTQEFVWARTLLSKLGLKAHEHPIGS